MADEQDRRSSSDTSSANRARMQGLGVGQSEMDAQRDPNRFQTATNPQERSFGRDLDDATTADRPTEADFGEAEDRPDGRTAAQADGAGAPDRNAAGLGDVRGDLGAGTPANVDLHKLGQEDNPEEDWGEAAGEGAMHSSNHTRRPVKTEAERSQGAKTRAHNKDMFSRRT